MLEPQTNKEEEFSYVAKPSNPNILFAVPRPKVTTVTTTTTPVVRGEVLEDDDEEGGGGEEVVQKKVKIVEEYPPERPPERKTEDAYVRELENFIAPLLREALAPVYVTLGMIEQDSGKRQFYRFAGKDLSAEQQMTPIVWGCTTVKEFFKKNKHLGKVILIQLKKYINKKEDISKKKTKKKKEEEEEEEEEEDTKSPTKTSPTTKPSVEIRQDKKLLEEKIKTLEESLEYLSDLLQEKLDDAETDVEDMRMTINRLEKELAILQNQKEVAIKAEKASGATTNIKSMKNMIIGELVQLSKHEKDALNLLYPAINMNLVTVESAPSWLESQLSTKVLEFLLDKQAFGALNLAANELGYPLRDLVFSEEVNYMFAQFVSAKFVKPKSNAYASGTFGGEMQYRISSGAIIGQQQTTWVIGCKRWFKENVYYGNRELGIKSGITSAEFRREAARLAKEYAEHHKKKYDDFLKAREDLIKLLPPQDAEKYRETIIVSNFTKTDPVAIPESANESFDKMVKTWEAFFKDTSKYKKVREQMLINESYADIADTRMLRVRKKN